MPRSTEFVKAVLKMNWQDTYQQYHPGSTLLWLSGFSKYFYERLFELRHGFNPRYIPQHFNEVNYWTILPLVVLISLLLTISFFKISKLFSNKVATVFIVLISLEPFFLGVSRFLHLTALSAVFGFTSYLFYLEYIHTKKNSSLIITGVMIGLAITTKISLLIMLPIFAITGLYYLLTNHENLRINLFRIFISLLIISLISVVIFVVINPFMWGNPLHFLRKIYSEGILETGFGDSPQKTILNNKYLFYLEYSVYRLMPITLILFILGIIHYFVNMRSQFIKPISYIMIYFGLYYMFLSIPSKLKDRYLIELIPAMLLISANMLVSIYYWNKKTAFGIVFSFLLLTALNIYRYHPIYSYYHSDIVMGPNGLSNLGIKPVIRGEYYADVAHFLNNRDHKPEEKIVLIPNATAVYTFAPFYIGKTYASIGNIDINRKINYVISREDNKIKFSSKCKLIKEFGPKSPLGSTVLYLFDCSDVPKDVFSIIKKDSDTAGLMILNL